MLLTVKKCTPSSNGGHVITVREVKESKVVSTPFGDMETSTYGSSYSVKVGDNPPAVGTVLDIKLADYTTYTKSFIGSAGDTQTCTWLRAK